MSDDFISNLLPSPSTPKTTLANAADDSNGAEVADFKRIFSIEEKRLENAQARTAEEDAQSLPVVSDDKAKEQDLEQENGRQTLGSGWVGNGNHLPDLAVHRGALSVGRVIFTPKQVAVTPQSLAKFMARQGLVSEQVSGEVTEPSARLDASHQRAIGAFSDGYAGLKQTHFNGKPFFGGLDQGSASQAADLAAMGPQGSSMSTQASEEVDLSGQKLAADQLSSSAGRVSEANLNQGWIREGLDPSKVSASATSLSGRTLADALRFTQSRQPESSFNRPLEAGNAQIEGPQSLLKRVPLELQGSDIQGGRRSESSELFVQNAGISSKFMRQQSLGSGGVTLDSEELGSSQALDSIEAEGVEAAKARVDYDVTSKAKAQMGNPTLSIQKFLGGVKETLDLVNSPETQIQQPSDQLSQGVRHYQDTASTLASQATGQQKIEFRGTLTEAQRLVDSGTYNNLTDSYESWTSKFGEVLASRIMGQLRQDNWSVQLRMSPASLGEISMELDFTDGGLEGRLGANEDATRQLLQDTLPRLRLALRDVLDGSQVLKLDVGDFKHSQQQPGSNQSAASGQVEELDFEAEVLQGRTLEPALGSVVGLNILV